MHLMALSQIRFPCNNYTCHYSEYSLNFSCVGIQEHFVVAASGMIRADCYTVSVEPCLVSLVLFCWIIGPFWWLLFLCRPPEDSLRSSLSEVTTHLKITFSRRLGRWQIRTRDLGTDSRIQGFHWYLGSPAERPKAQYNVNFNISHFTLHILIRKKEASVTLFRFLYGTMDAGIWPLFAYLSFKSRQFSVFLTTYIFLRCLDRLRPPILSFKIRAKRKEFFITGPALSEHGTFYTDLPWLSMAGMTCSPAFSLMSKL